MGRQWCRDDPRVTLNGAAVEIAVSLYADPLRLAEYRTAPTDVEVRAYPGQALVRTDADPNAAVSFVADASVPTGKVRVTARFNTVTVDPTTGKDFPVNLLVDPLRAGPGSAQTTGHSNAWTPSATVTA